MANPCDELNTHHTLRSGLIEWLKQTKKKARGKFVVYSAVFGVLEALREHGWPLERRHYVSEGNQLRMSGVKFKEVLKRALGPERVSRLTLPSEGGRTTRSAPSIAEKLTDWLSDVLPDSLSIEEGVLLANCLEYIVAEEFEEYMHSISAIRVPKPNPQRPLSEFVRQVITEAKRNRGAVVHHLVGAKLALRLPQQEKRQNGLAPRPHTAADQQVDVPGDYWYQNTAFHVTVAPSLKLFEKCHDNLAKGWRVWVITLREATDRARTLADAVEEGLARRLQIISISDFIGQNLEEIGGFSTLGVAQEAEALIQEYNARIDEAENGNPSLKIEFGS